jgi:hypothetical protein
MKPTKNALTSATIIGILTTIAGTFGVPAVSPDATTTQLVLQIVGTLLALWGRWRQGDLTVGAAKTVAPLFLAFALTTTNCATPTSEQGRASQGGTIDRAPVTNVTFSFYGDVKVDGTSAPTAAPSAASEAQNRQEAKQDGKLDVTVPVDALGGGAGKVLGAVAKPKVPAVKPVEIVVPAPVPAPAPVVPATPAPVDAPVQPPLAPIGG